MAIKRPIVQDGGRLKELPVGDTLAGVRVALGAGGAVDGEFNPAMSGPGTTIASRTVTIASGGSTISCALPAKRAGLRYFEVTFHGSSSSSNCAVGVVGAITDFEHQIGYDGASDEIGMFQNTGNIYNGTSSAGSAASFDTDGDVVGVAVNDSRQVWFRVNGSNWNGSGANNPVTGVGGITIAGSGDLFPAVGSDEDCEFIFNPGATLAGALPWGYFDTSDATRVEDVELDDPQENDVLMFDGAKWVNTPSGAGGGGGGITWSVSGSASTLAADTAQIVTAAVNKTLPATTSAGQQFIVHAKVDGVRIVSNGNVITGVGSGNDLTLAAGETAHLVASGSGTLEVV